MAKIIENFSGRRTIELSINDIIDIVREYQNITFSCINTEDIRKKLSEKSFFLPEDL